MSLYYNTMRKMSVRADEQLECLVLGRETLANILGDNFHKIMFGNFMKYAFNKNKSLAFVPKQSQERIFDSMKIVYYKANDIIFRKGSPIYKLIVIFEGRLKKFRSTSILASAGEAWGDEFLEKNKEIRIDDNVIAESDVVATEINFEEIHKVLGESFSESYGRPVSEVLNKTYTIEGKSEMESLQLSNLSYLREISKIHYGSMHLIHHAGKLFCAKVIHK